MTTKLWFVSELYYPEETSTGGFLTGIAEGIAGEQRDQRPGVARHREHQPGLRDRACGEREQGKHDMGRKRRRQQGERQHQGVLPSRGDEPERGGPQRRLRLRAAIAEWGRAFKRPHKIKHLT